MIQDSILYALGFARRKRVFLRACFPGMSLVFVDAPEVVPPGALLAVWGVPALPPLAPGVRLVRVEDGFLRSVGLGADWVRPMSWVLDRRGMYFDATAPSDMETLLATTVWSPQLLQRAAALREVIVHEGLTKYNVGVGQWSRPERGQRVILVPGQVETDASIRYGSPVVRTNLELLRRVRAAHPDAYVLYKPHPDVVAGLRLRGEAESRAVDFCDELLEHVPMHYLLERVDEVHVMTSLAGFEALLRGCKVVCHGQPFYAGWGLTQDLLPMPRRGRELSLDALVAGALILYPRYFDTQGAACGTPEQTLQELLTWRDRSRGRLSWSQRLWRPVLQLLAWWQDGKRRRGA